jgi:O-succinylbenzoic acid--CoA ligase
MKSWIDKRNNLQCKNLLFAQKIFHFLETGQSIFLEGEHGIKKANQGLKNSSTPSIFFRTGGSSGNAKWIMHNEESMNFAIGGLQEYLGEEQISSCCCLPLNHVGGIMQIWRARKTGGKVFFLNYRDLSKESFVGIILNQWISLVPTQLHHLIENSTACENLRLFKGIFVGGASLSENLAHKCRKADLPIYPCYGMTETAGMVTMLDSNSFQSGMSGVGHPLSHAQLKINPDTMHIQVKAKSMCLNAFTKGDPKEQWLNTPDFGNQDRSGKWIIKGRSDRIIVTGAVKVNPLEIEKVLMGCSTVGECYVHGIEDDKWGQKIIIFITPKRADIEELKSYAKTHLKPFQVPKEWHLVDKLPLTAMGKPIV